MRSKIFANHMNDYPLAAKGTYLRGAVMGKNAY